MTNTVPARTNAPDDPKAQPRVARDFGLLWAGQSVSLFGDHFMIIALPLLAVLILHTSLATAALLPFLMNVPFLFLGLPAGALVERMSRRKTMIVCNAIQLLVFALIWFLARMNVLTFPLLALLVLCSGCAVVFFQVAYTSFLPSLITDPDQLHRGNSRLALSESSAMSLGPMIGGPIIGAFGVITAIAMNAVSFVISVGTLGSIKHVEPPRELRPREKGWLRRDIGEGLRFVSRHPVLQPIIACGTIYVAFLSVVETVLVLYCLKVLHLAPQMIGVVTGAAALGYPIGNLFSSRLPIRLGAHRALLAAASVSVLGIVMMPTMASIGGTRGVVGLIIGSIVHCIGEGAFSPLSLTVRQTESPALLLTRVASVQRFFLWGAVAVGSLIAATATTLFGLSVAVWIGAVGTILCLPALYRRGIRATVRDGRDRTSASTIRPQNVS